MPGADVVPAFERQAAPGLVARLAGSGDRVEAPQLATVHRVVGGEEAASVDGHCCRSGR